jgi:hypothetical protein
MSSLRASIHPRAWFALALLLGGASAAHADAYFMVGSGLHCGYSSLQQAIDAERAYNGTNDFIFLTRSISYTAQAAVIQDQHVHIVGGVDDCDHYTPSGNTTVSGSGGAAAAVISLRGTSNVSISNLTITQGDHNGGSGGGIDFAGAGALYIENTTITNNDAGYGGGINFNGSGGALLNIGTETLITGNTATTSGGGIRIEGNAQLRVLAPQIFIANNEALGGYGGGIEVVGPARADIASPGYVFAERVPLVYLNSAQYGGGIAVMAGDDDDQNASVRMFTTKADAPVRVSGNSASHVGGGVYVRSKDGSTGGTAALCAIDYRLDDNIAQEGSAIYADENYAVSWGYTGSYVGLRRVDVDQNTFDCPGDSSTSLGGVVCTSDTCNLIDGNFTQNVSGQDTPGSALLVQTNSTLYADRIRIVDNHGAHAIRVVGGGADESELARLRLNNCLIAGNVASSDLALGDSLTDLSLNNCTIANNQIGTGIVARAGGRYTLNDSIIAQGSSTSLAYSGIPANLHLDYVMALETASMAQGTHLMQADPSFVNAGLGDFRLLPTSLAIDRAPPIVGDDRDLDNRPHDQDMGSIPNGDGVRDLGAYERQVRYCGAADTIFCSTFDFD